MTDSETLAAQAYDAYRRKMTRDLARKGKSVDFKPWHQLARSTKSAWVAAVEEIRPHIFSGCGEHKELFNRECPACIDALRRQ